jgi:hypothetical protein
MRWVVNDTHRSFYPWERDPVLIVQEAGVGPRAGLDGCVRSRPPPSGIRSPDRPARSELPLQIVIKVMLLVIFEHGNIPGGAKSPYHSKLSNINCSGVAPPGTLRFLWLRTDQLNGDRYCGGLQTWQSLVSSQSVLCSLVSLSFQGDPEAQHSGSARHTDAAGTRIQCR